MSMNIFFNLNSICLPPGMNVTGGPKVVTGGGIVAGAGVKEAIGVN